MIIANSNTNHCFEWIHFLGKKSLSPVILRLQKTEFFFDPVTRFRHCEFEGLPRLVGCLKRETSRHDGLFSCHTPPSNAAPYRAWETKESEREQANIHNHSTYCMAIGIHIPTSVESAIISNLCFALWSKHGRSISDIREERRVRITWLDSMQEYGVPT